MGFLIVATLMGVVGYLIRFRRWAWLIAGYNTSSPATKETYDLPELTSGVGNFAFLIAGLLVVAGVGDLLGLPWLMKTALVLLVVLALGFIVYANTGRRYRKPE